MIKQQTTNEWVEYYRGTDSLLLQAQSGNVLFLLTNEATIVPDTPFFNLREDEFFVFQSDKTLYIKRDDDISYLVGTKLW